MFNNKKYVLSRSIAFVSSTFGPSVKAGTFVISTGYDWQECYVMPNSIEFLPNQAAADNYRPANRNLEITVLHVLPAMDCVS